MTYVQPFSVGDCLFVESLCTMPPFFVHRVIHLAEILLECLREKKDRA